MAFNLPAVSDARARLSRALDTDDPAVALYELGRKLAVPASLAELGVNESDLDRVAEIAMRSPYFNPRPLSLQSVRTLLQMAFEGDTPNSSAFLRT
jgi:maleylacetate reductase